MSDAYLGEIRIFSGNFEPQGWAYCNGQQLSISQYTALFSVIGAQYGGDGTRTFALPDLRGLAPMNQGVGIGLTPRTVGEKTGTESVMLNPSQMPLHTHTVSAAATAGTQSSPVNHVWSEVTTGGRHPESENLYTASANTTLHPNVISTSGKGQPHNNMQPYLAINFIICLNGIFPSRS